MRRFSFALSGIGMAALVAVAPTGIVTDEVVAAIENLSRAPFECEATGHPTLARVCGEKEIPLPDRL